MHPWIRAVAAALPLCLATLAASAMSFDNFTDKDGDVWIIAKGNIALGDDEKLHRFVAAMPPQTRIWAVVLESDGGNLAEAAKLSSTVRSSGLVTVVFSGKICASACFLVFASGKTRLASPDS